MRKIKSSLCLLLIYTIMLGLLAPIAKAQTNGLQFELREGTANSPQKSKVPPPKNDAADLSKPETDAILRRLPPMPTDESQDKKSFAVRSTTNPPPRTGNIIPIKFPADEQPNAPKIKVNNAPLSIVRYAPDGKIPLVSDLSVTFSEPMVAVSSQTETAEIVPVVLTPQAEGKWRWLGATTLIFDAKDRFPMATKYTATIPAGTKSANGTALAKDFSWTFSTPPPKVESFYPGSNDYQKASREQIMQASFNQKIDPKAVIKKIGLSVNGKQIPVELVDQNLSEDENTQKIFLFRAAELLPLDSEVKVVFEKGLPSAEGSLTTDAAQEFSFRTYAPLKLVRSFCGYYYDEKKQVCEPSDAFHIEFNNTIIQNPSDVSQVKIEPALENAKISFSNNSIIIEGKKTAQTTYKVTISPTLKDWYKQTLGAEVSATFKVGSAASGIFRAGWKFRHARSADEAEIFSLLAQSAKFEC